MTKDMDDVHTSSSPGEQNVESVTKDEVFFGVDSEGQPVAVEPFDRNGAPHHITFGGVTGGSTFGVSHRIITGQIRAGRTYNTRSQRLAEMFDEDVDRTLIEIGPDGEMSEIEVLKPINPLDIPPEPMDENRSQSANGERNP